MCEILRSVEQKLRDCDVARALSQLDEIESKHPSDPSALLGAARIRSSCGQHREAIRCYEAALAVLGDEPNVLYNLAASRIAVGDLNAAENLLNRVIYLKPDDYDAWYNRSTLRTQSVETNHVEELLFVRSRLKPHEPGLVAIDYALAKELEDLGRYHDAFKYLQAGASARRRRLTYDVVSDEDAMQEIAEAFSPERLRHLDSRSPAATTPVFIVGLPRSGTTLVDRMLASHSCVESLGEINTLALAVVKHVGAYSSRAELIRKSATVSSVGVGRSYLDGILGFGKDAARLLDKTPANFLYMGLIRLLLPHARIVHVRRHPLDSCYAMYKTLFRMGYPYTYSFQDVGRYYCAYHRLMAHWRDAMPDSFVDIDYEALVSSPEAEARRLIDYLGLEWEPACLEFHRMPGAAATASAAQVRRPVYTTSVGRWRCYEAQLNPLAEKLRQRGIDL